jgi:CDP-diacylglycerol--glycerol-3-phosphate 3-phosphatidyltransferase
LTVARLLLVPVVAFFLAYHGGTNRTARIIAAALFTFAALTDHWDGHLARSRGLVTDFGKIADPIADKALMLVALAVLSGMGDLSWWVTGIIAFRELGVTVLRFAVIRYAVIPASTGGKIKTVTQILATGLYILPITAVWMTLLAQILMIVAVALTIATGAEYVFQVVSILSAARAEKADAVKEA